MTSEPPHPPPSLPTGAITRLNDLTSDQLRAITDYATDLADTKTDSTRFVIVTTIPRKIATTDRTTLQTTSHGKRISSRKRSTTTSTTTTTISGGTAMRSNPSTKRQSPLTSNPPPASRAHFEVRPKTILRLPSINPHTRPFPYLCRLTNRPRSPRLPVC